ncbi:probable microtubule-binding protein TANGLED [Salvia miltiorrhiza]|uniref:probable microtubule-binding protein TANGLED n=1 Tax=Salvia miltiorrhiza TaxID=226208 RepID=UPI0025AD5673|nr:probable microtubule-binding protein TANGLED [Salvia miltiorrhiza]
MVARSPPKHHQKLAVVAPPISPTLLRETVKKVDRCMARLQELQHTVTGGTKLVSGLSLSPRSGRNYLRASLRCKQESLRLKNANSRRSSPGKLPVSKEEWRKMSLPAMLLGETVGEILQASQFARNVVEAVSSKPQKPANEDPKTPVTQRAKQKLALENSGLHARRRKEKQVVLQNVRSESNVPSIRRAKSKINFKVSPLQNRECDKENCRYIANRVSPRNRPWVKKTVLFPNPLFHSSPTSQHQKFGKTKSPMIARNRQTPHKFLIKSPPPPAASKFQVKIRSPPICISPTRGAAAKKSPRASSAAARLRRSFSPSRLAGKLVSPLKSRKSMPKNSEDMMKTMSGLKQRPTSFSMRFSSPRRT